MEVAEPISILAMAFQLGILGILVVAVSRRDLAAAVNAIVSFIVATMPAAFAFLSPTVLGRSVTFGPELPLWLAMAGLFHSYGMLGPYDSIWWWDYLTHTISAALVAALIYGGLVVVVGRQGPFEPLSGLVPVITVGFTLAAGIFWELIELVARAVGDYLDIEPVLVHYGRRDTALDLVFDLVGAIVVVLVDLRIFVPIADQFPRLTANFLYVSGGIVVGGSVVLAVALLLDRQRRPR